MEVERAWEVGVHCACVEVGKGGKTKHVMGSADFFYWFETVNVALGLDDCRLHGVCGLNDLVVVPQATLVGSCGIRKVGVDKMRHETWGGCKFPALF